MWEHTRLVYSLGLALMAVLTKLGFIQRKGQRRVPCQEGQHGSFVAQLCVIQLTANFLLLRQVTGKSVDAVWTLDVKRILFTYCKEEKYDEKRARTSSNYHDSMLLRQIPIVSIRLLLATGVNS